MATEVEIEVATSEERQQEDDASSPSSPSSTQSTTRKRKGIFKKDVPEDQSRRPPDNKWLQQQIPACRPVFTAIHAAVGFLIIGIAFLILGSIFTAFSSQLREYEFSYEGCKPLSTDVPQVASHSTCEEYLEKLSNMSNVDRNGTEQCHCMINFTLPEDLRPPWNFYYGMRNYYQNHRRYLNSWDVNQLRGEGFTNPSSDCRPYVRLRNSSAMEVEEEEEEETFPVMPCGLIANSFFNDSFDMFRSSDDNTKVTLNRSNIAWSTDRSIRFRNPGRADKITPEDLVGTIMPPNWLDDLSSIQQGLQNESLMVWFRVSAFPWFRKLYARPAVNGVMNAILPSGDYSVVLTYNYPVSGFNGKKSIILAEVNWLGGKNLFLGIAYLVVGAFLVVACFGLIIMHKLCSKWKLDRAPFNNN